MPVSSREEQRACVAEAAAMWLEKLERAITEEESRALRQWLGSSLHREVIVERCKLWHGPDILAVLGELIPTESFQQRVERHYGRITLAIFLGVSGIGCATAVIALSKVLPGTDDHLNPLRAEAAFHTAVGGRKTLQLPDGGSIVLNTASHVLLSYGPHARDVTLVRGEATFDAKDDPARPFVVFAGPRRFEAQTGGARFNVRRITRDHMELTVLAGRVSTPASRLTEPVSPALLRARVSYGEHTFDATQGGLLGPGWQSPWTLPQRAIEKRIAWQTGSVIFEDEPLGDALLEVERYSDVHFKFADDELPTLRVSAEFKTGDVASVVRHLHDAFAVDAHEDKSGAIVLERAAR